MVLIFFWGTIAFNGFAFHQAITIFSQSDYWQFFNDFPKFHVQWSWSTMILTHKNWPKSLINIARGTADPEIYYVTWTKFGKSSPAAGQLATTCATTWGYPKLWTTKKILFWHIFQIWPWRGLKCDQNQLWYGNIKGKHQLGKKLCHRGLRYDFFKKEKKWTVPLILQFNIYIWVISYILLCVFLTKIYFSLYDTWCSGGASPCMMFSRKMMIFRTHSRGCSKGWLLRAPMQARLTLTFTCLAPHICNFLHWRILRPEHFTLKSA